MTVTVLSSEASALVRAGRAALRPSEADRVRISEALRARLGDAALLAEAAGAANVAQQPAWLKLFAVAGAVGIAGVAAFFANTPVSALKPLPTAAVASALAAPPAAADMPSSPAEVAGAAEPEPSVPVEPSAAGTRRAGVLRDHLAEEVEILSRATSELRAGRAQNALNALDEHARKFPRGLLSEERRAAHAQALCALGRRGEAAVALERLIRSAPQSPNTARAKQACGIN
jgi:hypothetical protein